MKPASDARIADDLRDLTEALANAGHEPSGGLLGGEYGYGADYENDVFEMHPFWWGECECGFDQLEYEWLKANRHENHCYQMELWRRGYQKDDWYTGEKNPNYVKRPWDSSFLRDIAREFDLPEQGCAVHCTCRHEPDYEAWRTENAHDPKCGMVRPNFRHKTSGVRVDWYKYIGRGMEHDPIDKGEWGRIQAECIDSITPGTWVAPPPLTPEEEEAAYQAFKDSVYVFDGTLGEVMQQIDETMRPVAVIESLWSLHHFVWRQSMKTADELTLNDVDWVYSYNGTVLHHASFTPDQEAEMNDLCTAMGTYDCRPGLRRVSIPGFFSRTSMKRCDRCCDRNGLPRGIGSPKNDAECRRILGLDSE